MANETVPRGANGIPVLAYASDGGEARVVMPAQPLPVGGAALGQEWDGDPDHLYSLSGSINGRLGALLQTQLDFSAVKTQDASAVSGVVVFQRGFWGGATRSQDGAYTDGGFGNAIEMVCSEWAFCVYGRTGIGNPQAPTTWDVRLEASINGQSWTEIAAHTNADGNGTLKWITGKPAIYVRYRVAALTLGSAANIAVNVVGRP